MLLHKSSEHSHADGVSGGVEVPVEFMSAQLPALPTSTPNILLSPLHPNSSFRNLIGDRSGSKPPDVNAHFQAKSANASPHS